MNSDIVVSGVGSNRDVYALCHCTEGVSEHHAVVVLDIVCNTTDKS